MSLPIFGWNVVIHAAVFIRVVHLRIIREDKKNFFIRIITAKSHLQTAITRTTFHALSSAGSAYSKKIVGHKNVESYNSGCKG